MTLNDALLLNSDLLLLEIYVPVELKDRFFNTNYCFLSMLFWVRGCPYMDDRWSSMTVRQI